MRQKLALVVMASPSLALSRMNGLSPVRIRRFASALAMVKASPHAWQAVRLWLRRSGCNPAAALDTAHALQSGYRRTERRRSALPITDTDESDIARAAMTGLSRMPNAGYSTPAAIGMPMLL